MGLDILVCVDDIPNDRLSQSVSSVEINERMDQNTTYKLRFMVDVCDGDISGPVEADTAPGKILSVLANVRDSLVCLVKGPVTQQQSHLQHGGAGSWLHIEGEDMSHTLDRETTFRVTDSASDADIARTIISDGEMTPDVEDTPESTHSEENHSHVQRETNLALLRTLARRNGYHFWVTCDATGVATGHFKPRSLDGTPAATLIVNEENYNIDSLRVTADPRAPSQTTGSQLNLRNLEVIGGGTVMLQDTLLGTSSLAEAAGPEAQSTHMAPTVDDAGALQARSEGALREAQWFIHATCRTTIHRLCNIVRNHTVVEIRGAGTRHGGKYYVTNVKHTIDAVTHRMDLDLARNAWGS